MSSVIIAGDTSGSVTLQAPATAGSTVVNLPSTLGNTGTSSFATTDASGNLGIGVTPSAWSSSFKATQVGTNAVFAGLAAGNYTYVGSNWYNDGTDKRISATGVALYVQDAGSSAHKWYNAASSTAGSAITFTQAMTLDASGNLGVGTSSPAYRLDVHGATSPTIRVRNSTVTVSNYSQLLLQTANSFSGNSDAYVRCISMNAGNSSSSLAFGVNADGGGAPYEAARIDSSGNLLVGTTAPTGSEKLNVTTSAGATGGFGVYFNGTASNFTGQLFKVNSANTSTNNSYNAIQFSANGTERFKVQDNGNVNNTNNSYGAISDIKLKENITDATPKLALLNQVRIVNYNFKSDQAHKQIGVIAQELEQIFPGMVEESPDRDAEGNDLGTVTKSVKYSVFVPMLIKSIQEQQALITQLQADVAALKGQ